MLTDSQLEARRHGLGGSDIYAVAGFSPYADWQPLDVYRSKVEGVTRDERWRFWLGHCLEPAILKTFMERTHYFTPGTEMPRAVSYPGTLVHPEESWCLATPDGIARFDDGRKVLLECKTAAVKKEEGWGPAGTAEVPVHYACQCLWTMAVARARGIPVEEAWVLVLFSFREPQRFVVPWDAGRAAWLLEQGRSFWFDNVLANVPPQERAA